MKFSFPGKFCLIVFLIVLVTALVMPLVATAQSKDGGSRRLNGAVVFGTGIFNVLNPGSDVKANPGTLIGLEGEKSFGNAPLYLEAMLSYVRSSGTLNYNYVSPTATYTASNINYNADEVQGGLGIRLKLIESSPIRPYVEGGVTGGYFQINYGSNLQIPVITGVGMDFKTLEGCLDFGTYAEAGIELSLASNLGIRVADRYIDSTTRSLETIGNRPLHYMANLYAFYLYSHF